MYAAPSHYLYGYSGRRPVNERTCMTRFFLAISRASSGSTSSSASSSLLTVMGGGGTVSNRQLSPSRDAVHARIRLEQIQTEKCFPNASAQTTWCRIPPTVPKTLCAI
jgi:hypothetical protein